MQIVVGNISRDSSVARNNFVINIFEAIAAANPAHQWVIIIPKNGQPLSFTASNIKQLAVAPANQHPLLLRWWYNIRLPKILAEQQASCFISLDEVLSQRITIPQFIIFPSATQLVSRSKKALFMRSVAKANFITVVSHEQKQQLIEKYNVEEKKLLVTGLGISSEFAPLEYEEREQTKEKYSGGKEYLLYLGKVDEKENLIELLKAFSFFKKRQLSNMQLLLAGQAAKGFQEKLSNYKFRADVHCLETNTYNEALLVAGAYALVYPSTGQQYPKAVLKALKSGVPVVANTVSPTRNVAGEAALYAPLNPPEEMALQMMLLYKNEHHRNQLIRLGLMETERYSWQAVAQVIWQMIEQQVESAKL